MIRNRDWSLVTNTVHTTKIREPNTEVLGHPERRPPYILASAGKLLTR